MQVSTRWADWLAKQIKGFFHARLYPACCAFPVHKLTSVSQIQPTQARKTEAERTAGVRKRKSYFGCPIVGLNEMAEMVGKRTLRVAERSKSAMLWNIIDKRARPYRWREVNAIVEAVEYNNSCADADQAPQSDSSVNRPFFT